MPRELCQIDKKKNDASGNDCDNDDGGNDDDDDDGRGDGEWSYRYNHG